MKKSRQMFQAHIPMLFSNVLYHRSNFISDRRRVTYYDDASRRRLAIYDSRRRSGIYDSRRRTETTYDSRRRSETTYDSRRRISYPEGKRRRSTYNTDSTRTRGNNGSHGKNIGIIFAFLTGIPVLVIVFYCCYKKNVYEPPERMTQSEIAGFINATGSGRQDRDDTGVAETPAGVPNPPPPANAGVGQESSGFYPPPAQPSDFDIVLGGSDPPPSYHTPETNFTAQMSHSTSGSCVNPDAPPVPYGAYYPPSHAQFPPTGQAALPQTSGGEPASAVGDAPPSYKELFPS